MTVCRVNTGSADKWKERHLPWVGCLLEVETEQGGNKWQTNWWADVVTAPPLVNGYSGSTASQTMAVEDLNIRLTLPFPHRGQRSSGPLSHGAVDIKERTCPLRRGQQSSGEAGGRGEGMCVMLWRPHCHSPNNKVRYKKGGGGQPDGSSCSEQPAKDKRLECAVSIVAYGGVPALCLAVADLLWDGEKYLPGETKTSVNPVQDSAVAIRWLGDKPGLMFFCFLAEVFCDVKCFTHVHSAVKRKWKLRRNKTWLQWLRSELG